MNTENAVKNLRVLWRTDRIIADIRMRHLLVGLGLRAFAALIAGFGLLMLEVCLFRVGSGLERNFRSRHPWCRQFLDCRDPARNCGKAAFGPRN